MPSTLKYWTMAASCWCLLNRCPVINCGPGRSRRKRLLPLLWPIHGRRQLLKPLNRRQTLPPGGPMRIEIRPAFDEAVMAAELPVRKAAAKMLLTLQQLDLAQLWTHPGLNFEKLHGMIEPVTGEQL